MEGNPKSDSGAPQGLATAGCRAASRVSGEQLEEPVRTAALPRSAQNCCGGQNGPEPLLTEPCPAPCPPSAAGLPYGQILLEASQASG